MCFLLNAFDMRSCTQKKQQKFHFITLSKMKLHFHKKFPRNLQQNDECGVVAFVMRRQNAIWNLNKIWLCLTISFSEHIYFRILICNFAEILNANIMCQNMGWVTATNVINSTCVCMCSREIRRILVVTLINFLAIYLFIFFLSRLSYHICVYLSHSKMFYGLKQGNGLLGSLKYCIRNEVLRLHTCIFLRICERDNVKYLDSIVDILSFLCFIFFF